jgi:hypothetical protein
MDYSVLDKNTTAEDRDLLMRFSELQPQKMLMFASSIIGTFISTLSKQESKDMILRTVIEQITKLSCGESIKLKCSFCQNDFYTSEANKNISNPLCPRCVFPDLRKEE